MGVKELNSEEKKNVDGGDGIINDFANMLAEGAKWNIRMVSFGLYLLSE